MMHGKRIVVAMSGGVDSSTAAALLKQEGNEVIGIGLRLPEPLGQHNLRSCCNIEGMNDARWVAAKLDIPFYVLNYEKIFEKSVIDYFCQSYLSGKTPNLCIECNRAVKFGHLLKFADSLGADYVATGHYANISYDESRCRFLLKKGFDAEKDQSYFLYSLSQEQLSRILFPLGGMTKEETRRLAKSFDLVVHAKPGSQDICFLGQTDYRSFLAERFPEAFQRGTVLNTQGDILGWHQGVICYTVGQRKGLGIAARKPLYVVSLDVAANKVIVGTYEEAMKQRISITGINWIVFDKKPGFFTVDVKIRYRQPEISACLICSDNDRGEVWLSKPQRGIAPGQAAVFYDGDVVVGGGVIE
jgi:tRNA (5-methylaminomethyl-2-thiouridylate)-methyltransferase (EC 2.1.1.61)